jgi:multiple sugar transport system permease protein
MSDSQTEPVAAAPVDTQPHRQSIFMRYPQWFMVGPAVVIMVLLMLYPLGYTLWMGFHEWFASSLTPPQWVGLENYVRIFTDDPRFADAFWRTVYFTVMAVVLQTVLGVAIALIFNRNFLGKGVVRTLFLFPMVATPVAIALVWMMMYNPVLGVLRYFLDIVGLPPVEWVSNRRLVIPALVIVDTWQWTPLITLMTLAGLSALPTEPYEAAVIDGANGWQILRFVTLPLLRPVIVVAVLFRTIDAIKTFDIIYVMTQGGPAFASETLNIYVFQTGFNYFHLGYASSLLIVLFIIVMSVSTLLIRFRRVSW